MSFLSSASPKLAPWKVLLVDDEPDIHDITKLTLSRFRLDGRALSFVHAYSGAEAKEVLARETDIALVFLDVVMEREDSGLEVARWMREDLNNQFTRIVLRTGQPGQAPEERVIVEKHQRDILFARQHFLRFRAGVGVHERQGAAIQAETIERQLGDIVDIRFVIDEQNFPRRELGSSRGEKRHNDVPIPVIK